MATARDNHSEPPVQEHRRTVGTGVRVGRASAGIPGNHPGHLRQSRVNQRYSNEVELFCLLKGLYGTIRNPLAHNPKIERDMVEQDALDILTMISLVHRKLDKARRG